MRCRDDAPSPELAAASPGCRAAKLSPVHDDLVLVTGPQELGRLDVSDGRISVGEAALARWAKSRDSFPIGALWLELDAVPPARWERTTFVGEVDLGARAHGWIGFDSGKCSIAVSEFAASLDQAHRDLRATGAAQGDVIVVPPEAPDRAQAFTVRSGEGDGTYAAFWGLSTDDEPVVLLVVFIDPFADVDEDG